jgi:diguanylate cyclase (GGDEF)-like protein/PAS domain S-box-containing protein
MLGEWPGDNLVGRKLTDFAHPDYRELFADGLESLCDEKTRVPMIFVASDGHEVEVEIAALPYVDEGDGDGDAIMLIARDVTERNRAMTGITSRENRLRTIMDTVADAIITIDRRGLIETFNASAEAIFGYHSAEIQGQPITVLMPKKEAALHQAQFDVYLNTGKAKILGTRREVRARRKDGTTFPADISVNEMKFGESQLFVGVVRDITVRKDREDRLHFLATRDPLTKFPNRHEFRDRLDAAIGRADGGGHLFAVLFIDLDHFKNINDAMGHLAGDRVLQAASIRLQECVRDGDMVAHLGGDEFTVILDGIGEAEEAETIAAAMLETMAAPFRISGKEIFTSASIGVVIYPGHGDTIADLMQNVDTASHHAKKQGRNNFQFYTSTLSDQVQRHMEIENGLRRALERDEFELMYQPKVDLESLEIIGAEALLRWDGRDLGPVSPSEFVPVAEEAGLIEDIGEWVLRKDRLRRGRGMAQFRHSSRAYERQRFRPPVHAR